MDAFQAAEAVRLMQPRQVMPVHFEWNPSPREALDDFVRFCRQKAPDVKILYPVVGEAVEL
jgi:L-ascorbate metabolism protein UlaG (beta-lactamase superfamily)